MIFFANFKVRYIIYKKRKVVMQVWEKVPYIKTVKRMFSSE